MKGYRTIGANGAIVAAALVDYFANNADLVSMLVGDPKKAAAVLAGIGAANIALRTVTTGPVGRKK